MMGCVWQSDKYHNSQKASYKDKTVFTYWLKIPNPSTASALILTAVLVLQCNHSVFSKEKGNDLRTQRVILQKSFDQLGIWYLILLFAIVYLHLKTPPTENQQVSYWLPPFISECKHFLQTKRQQKAPSVQSYLDRTCHILCMCPSPAVTST